MDNKLVIIIIILGAIIAYIAYPAYSQVPPGELDRAIKETVRPETDKYRERVMPTPKAPPKVERKEEEPVVEGPKFFVKKINLIGTESFSPDEFRPVIEKYENREISLEELKILAKKIEREYLNTTTSKVTATIFRKWKLNDSLINSIEYVDEIDSCPVKYKKNAQVLNVIKTICNINNPSRYSSHIARNSAWICSVFIRRQDS